MTLNHIFQYEKIGEKLNYSYLAGGQQVSNLHADVETQPHELPDRNLVLDRKDAGSY